MFYHAPQPKNSFTEAMWPALAREIVSDVLVYLDPDWASALSKVSKDIRRLLYQFYDRQAHHLVCHEWNHRLCKRARDSLGETISPTPRALASLVHRRCARCHCKYLGKIHVLGVVIHEECLKDLLLNVYYLRRDFGLGAEALATLPRYERAGTYGSYTRTWKNGFRGIVPYAWTAHYLVQREAAVSTRKKWTRQRYPYLD